MKTRILTALLLFPPAIYLIGWSPLWLFLAAVILVAMLALREFFQICRLSGHKVYQAVGYTAVALQCVAAVLAVRRGGPVGSYSFGVIAPLMVFAAPFGALLQARESKHSDAAFATITLGIFYIGLPFSFLVFIRFMDPARGFHWIFLLFIVIWAGDIFAYFVGRTVGRHLLFPSVSPKKTWEGAVAGLVGSLLAATAYALWIWKSADVANVVVLAALIAVAGQVGDLAESAMKRAASMKDSGNILPGHGGILDRIDALLFGSAALWLALSLKDLGIW